ncbi:MAG: chorismate mutase [Bacteroidetes bacterium]|nr:chorismate mutase [Bacteroidota bacterium]MCY4232248.1 chorismate mutase [Bacteroidota bacterium]
MKPVSSQSTVSEKDINPLRDQIDEIDKKLVALLNERSTLANKIGHIKQQLGLPIYMPAREKIILSNVMKINPGPLPPEAMRRLFERIIDETRALERQKYQSQ